MFFYGPMKSSYTKDVRAVAHMLVHVLPQNGNRYRVSSYDLEIGVQADNYSCGMFVLTVFDFFTGAQDIRLVTRKELRYLRYRYLCMCV
ncbi:hypothetical protein JG688_00016863 [Phytophthora aleatoria]|uniref:Ubiquitin-like protease family profile domain-containing protein n=1 Tax=Phytophthora aleatoria TaxID=2496075 RepID=A0A8J5M1R4_9STRA|nr:hypothetical protein JG688_00016863 [Phytophthora aleatoria]